MARCILPPKLQSIGKGLFVGAHKSGKLLCKTWSA